MKIYLKVILSSVLFGICQAYSLNQLTLIQIISSSLIPIVAALILAVIYQLIRIAMKWSKNFSDFQQNLWKVFVPTIILMVVVTVLQIYAPPNKKSENNEDSTYKSIVQNRNKNDIKKIGEVDTEFLNEDNLYENFTYNYTIKFPQSYKVNYGAGKSSVVQAYDTITGNIIAVSVANSDIANIHTQDYSKSEFSQKMVRDLFEIFKTHDYRKKMVSEYEKKGFTDVIMDTSSLINYNNRFFITTKYIANSIINSEIHPVVLIDLVTANSDYYYHFIFKCWSNQFNKDWKKTIIEVMANVHINKDITNIK